MPVLKNPKHEIFAQQRAKGMSAGMAYVKAGYKRHDSSASRLTNSKRIQERIAEIQAEALTPVMQSIQYDNQSVLDELARVGFSSIRNVFNDDGRIKSVIEMDDNTLRSIKKIKAREEYGEDGNQIATLYEIEFWDKLNALSKLGDHFELFGKSKQIADDPLRKFASLLMDAAARPFPLSSPDTPALQSQRRAPQGRSIGPQVEDAELLEEDVEP